jgi:hypothetical protein
MLLSILLHLLYMYLVLFIPEIKINLAEKKVELLFRLVFPIVMGSTGYDLSCVVYVETYCVRLRLPLRLKLLFCIVLSMVQNAQTLKFSD